MRESLAVPRAPRTRLGIARRGVHTRIVVHDHLVRLRIALAGQQDAGPGVFEHRYQIREHVTLRIEVFDSLENACPLPFPPVQFRLEIIAVALPQRDMTVRQPRFGPVRRIGPHDQRPVGRCGEGPLPAVCPTAQRTRNQVLDTAAVGIEHEAPAAQRFGQQRPHSVVNRFHVLFTERDIGAGLVGIEFQRPAVVPDRIDADAPAADFGPGRLGEQVADALARLRRKLLSCERLRPGPQRNDGFSDPTGYFPFRSHYSYCFLSADTGLRT